MFIMNLTELKQLQAEIIRKNRKCAVICWSIVISVMILTIVALVATNIKMLFFLPVVFFEFVLGIVISLIAKYILTGKDTKRFNAGFKSVFVLASLQKIFNNLTFVPERGLSESVIKNTDMMTTGDRFHSNDYISGYYKNIFFEQSDIHIEEEYEDSDGDTHWVTIFRGRWMIFDFNKNFKANVQVVSHHFSGRIFHSRRQYSKIRMEDIEFNKLFIVYAKDDHDAFYILTPHFMEHLKKIREALNCNLMFCFIDNKLHVAVNNNQDSFEYNVNKEINEAEIEANISKDIKLITDFVDELSLDNNLFKKETIK